MQSLDTKLKSSRTLRIGSKQHAEAEDIRKGLVEAENNLMQKLEQWED